MNSIRRRGALWVRLARRFGSAGYMRRSATLVGVVSALLTALFITISSFDQSSEQLIQQNLGEHDHRSELISVPPGAPDVTERFASAASAGGATDSSLVLQTFDVRPATTARTFTTYLETNWQRSPLPDRYLLSAGRWPAEAGEAVVTEAYVAAAPDLVGTDQGSVARTSVLSGNAELRVVGRVVDRHATGSVKILAAQGTWAALDGPRLRTTHPDLAATASIYWSGGDPEVVAQHLIGALSADPTSSDGSVAPSDGLSVQSRSDPSLALPHSHVSAIPLAYTVPSLLLPVVASLVAFGLSARRLRRNLGVLRSIGITSRDSAAAVTLASSSWQLLAAVLGSGLGIGLGWLARLLVDQRATRPIAPFADPLPPTLRTVALVAACCVIGLWKVTAGQRRTGARTLLDPLLTARKVASPTRRAIAASVIVIFAFQALRVDSIPGAMALVLTSAVAAALLVPDVLPRIIRRLPAGSARKRLIREQMLGDVGRTQTATGTIAVTLGVALAMVVLLQTLTVSETDNRVSATAAGQVSLISGGGGLDAAPSPGLAGLAAESLGSVAPPIDVGFLYGGMPGRIARLEGVPNGIVLAVDTEDEAVRLSNGLLDEAARALLREGGIITWKGSDERGQRLVVSDFDTEATVDTTVPLPSLVRPFPASWRVKADGIILRSTAAQLDIPTSHAELVYTAISDQNAAEVREAALAAGYDTAQVGIYDPPAAAVPPVAYWGAAVGLCLLMLVSIGAVARAQAVNLRSYLSGLVALGMAPTWARAVLFGEVGVLISISTVVALVISVLPLALAALSIPGMILSIPWVQVAAVLGLLAVAGAGATWQASRHLRAGDRHLA